MMTNFFKKNIYLIILTLLFILGFWWRFSGIKSNHPFWVDEFNSAVQASNMQNIILHGKSLPQTIMENNNYLTHFLIALSFIVLGQSESSARFPIVIIGSISIIIVYFLSKEIFNKKVGIITAFLTAFSYFEIVWANQARGYVLQQLISMLLFLNYLKYLNKFKKKYLIFILLFSILGLLTHNMFIIPIFVIGLHFILFNHAKLLKFIRNPLALLLIILTLGGFIYLGSSYKIFHNEFFGIFNNFWYYHALLWRKHGLIVFLSFIGIIWGLKKNFKATTLLLLYMIGQMTFVTFIFGHYMSKYVFPIFYLFLLFAGATIVFISTSLMANFKKKSLTLTISLLLTGFIILNGDKFVLRPREFYSVNHDMRDIALVDYRQVYNKIREKSGVDLDKVAVIETWPDRAKWYLETKKYDNIYLFRWADAGFRKKTDYAINEHGDKIIPGFNLGYIGELSDLQKVMQKYKSGFIWIDDSSLPTDILNYVQDNFHKDLYLDHYFLDDNPYSIWPGTLYSWGFDSPNPFYSISSQVK